MVLNKQFMASVLIVLSAFPGLTWAEVYKCPGANGRPTYTNVKKDTVGKNCVLVTKEVTVVPAARVGTEGDRPFRANTNNNDARRRILETELQSEEQQLAEARKRLAEQEGIRNGDERNYARVLERLKPFQDAVDLHQKNIDQLRQELGRL